MRRVMAVALVLGLALTSCATPDPSPEPQPSVTATADLGTLRLQYGLPECPDTDPQADQVQDGLPRTALPCLGTEQMVNLAGLPRQPMVVNFWAQWCGPCRKESAFLTEAAADSPDVAFLGINYQDPQPDWAIEFAGLVGWKYPHVVDMERTLQSPLKVPGLPITLFVAADGRIVGRHVGGITSTKELRGLIDDYLGAP